MTDKDHVVTSGECDKGTSAKKETNTIWSEKNQKPTKIVKLNRCDCEEERAEKKIKKWEKLINQRYSFVINFFNYVCKIES